jgi:hypothetical protein
LVHVFGRVFFSLETTLELPWRLRNGRPRRLGGLDVQMLVDDPRQERVRTAADRGEASQQSVVWAPGQIRVDESCSFGIAQ